MSRVTHKLRVSLLDPETEGYDPEALNRFVAEEVSAFQDNYCEDWGIDEDEVWETEEPTGYLGIHFIASNFLGPIAEELSDDHPGLLVELFWWDDVEAGIIEYIGGENYEDIVRKLHEARDLSEWHAEELTFLDELEN
jgi:hypothetical protein